MPEEHFIFDSFSFRKPTMKPSHTGSTKSKEHDVQVEELDFSDIPQPFEAKFRDKMTFC